MIEARILNNTIPSDVTQFSEIVDEYATFQRDKPNALYFYEGMTEYTTWLKKQFIDRTVNDFIIAGLFNNNRLVQILVGYKIEVAWNKITIEDTFPFYVIGLMHFKESSWRVPKEDISNLDELISENFERQGFTTGFITIKAPSFFIKNTKLVDINRYVNNVFVKTFGSNTHDFFVENVFRTQEDLETYKFKAFRVLLPKKLKRPLALLTFEIKPEYKKV
jgi:hypothetical protein